MPIKIAPGLPVIEKLKDERVSLIEKGRALAQDIRPLKILILNLMPKKEETELQLLRLLGNTPLQIDVDFMYMSSHQSTHTPMSYLQKYYVTFQEICAQRFDGIIITGAPVELMEFREVDYYPELKEIMDWAQENVFSRFFICWASQFAVNYYYGINKRILSQKMFGIFEYQNLQPKHQIMRGFDEIYRVPQSRHTRIEFEQLQYINDLIILSENPRFGPDIVISKDGRDLFVFGHLEYDRNTLLAEYQRDLAKGEKIQIPENYFPQDDPRQKPYFNWKSHAYILFNNWINQTYQETPYDLNHLVKTPGPRCP